MAITNGDGYNFLNTILRKERNGSSITPDRYNNILKFSFEEKLSDEFTKFEEDQKNTDFFRYLKTSEVIIPDVNGEYDISSLSSNYFHHIGSFYYNSDGEFIDVDAVTNDEWNHRLRSTLEHPTDDFPVVKIMSDKLVYYPLTIREEDNLVGNAGFGSDPDWIDTDGDGLADDWDYHVYDSNFEILEDIALFSGRFQSCGFDNSYGGSRVRIRYVPSYPANPIPAGKYVFYLKAAAPDLAVGDISLKVVCNNEDLFDTGVLPETATVYSGSVVLIEDGEFPGFELDFSATSPSINHKGYVDEVYFGPATEITFEYIKEQDDPYFDWYYDANDRIIGLSEGEEYTLQTDERYIDKDDGTVRTSGYVITSVVNKTVEMEIPSDEKRGVFYSMLSKLGVSLDQADATQYSILMENKELSK